MRFILSLILLGKLSVRASQEILTRDTASPGADDSSDQTPAVIVSSDHSTEVPTNEIDGPSEVPETKESEKELSEVCADDSVYQALHGCITCHEGLEHEGIPLQVPTMTGSESSCHFLEKFVHKRIGFEVPKEVLRRMPSPPAPPVPHNSKDGVPELVSIPCKPCEKDRKDRQFIRGSPFTPSMTKLLVDYASGSSGGKILAHSEGIRGASDVLHADDNRYLLTPCSNKVWFTLRLTDEIFLEKIGLVSNELFASTFRHIQVLGSRQYPTNEWRVLGEIETNPMENHEWFDLSGSGQCSKCYVKYLKLRVLTHHALEGYTNCALTRIQVFGSTVLQSLDRIQAMSSNMTESGAGNTQIPDFVKTSSRVDVLMDERMRSLTSGSADSGRHPPIATDASRESLSHTPAPAVPSPPVPQKAEEGSNPLLNLIEEMAQLKKQYQSVVGHLHALTLNAKEHPVGSQEAAHERPSSETSSLQDLPGSWKLVHVSIFGMSMDLPALPAPDIVTAVIGALVLGQLLSFYLLSRKSTPSRPEPANLIVSMNHMPARRFSQRMSTPQIKKRSHGLWRPKARRVLYNQQSDTKTPEQSDVSVSNSPPIDLNDISQQKGSSN